MSGQGYDSQKGPIRAEAANMSSRPRVSPRLFPKGAGRRAEVATGDCPGNGLRLVRLER
jgi:hypothetical protein